MRLVPSLLGLVFLVAGCLAAPAAPTPTPASMAKGVPITPADWAWKDLAPAPTPRVEQCGANVGSKFYVIGGFIIPNGQSQEGALDGIPTGPPVDLVEIYDAATNSWSQGPPYPSPLEHCLAASVGDTVYVVYNAIGAGAPVCFKLKAGSMQWTKIADPPNSHYAGAMDAWNGRLIATAGSTKTVDLYDPMTDKWTTLKGTIPTSRGHTSGAVVDGVFYIVAGDTGGHSVNTDANEAYDIANQTWSVKTPIPVKRGSVHAVDWMGHVVVMGGQSGKTAVDAYRNVNAYDPRTDTWTDLPNMTGRHGFAADVWQDRIYVFAGSPQEGVAAFTNTQMMAPRG